jgi:hypothetical protein
MPPGGVPTPDYAAILADDTRLSWLQRSDLDHYWIAHPATGEPVGTAGDGDPLSAGFYFCLISESEFVALATAKLKLAPVWPGLAGVTLLEPTVLTETGIVTTAMDGILLTVDSGPGGAGQWGVGDFRSYYRAGYVVFLDADGHADTTQFIGPADHVFCPKGMATAAAVVVGLNKATQITVTPWILGVAEG